MRVAFSERFALPVEEVFSYFASPADWPRLYGFSGVRDLGSGWYVVGIKGFPFPLVARLTRVEPNRLVRWTFRGFWRGEGEVRFTPSPGSVLVEGYEEIAVRWLFFLSPLVERLFLESRFRAIWQLGWRRLRKREHSTYPNDESVVEVKPSGIEGLGLFAVRTFAAGQRIRRVHVVRAITADAPLRPEVGERFDHCDYPDGKVVLIGYPDRHLNHSCDPNAFLQYEGDASYIVARRGIQTGEEITCDYNINISGGTAWPCRCKSARCLGTVMGDFFLLPPELQLEYRPLLAEWFVRRHADRLAAVG